jgi:diaminopimelate epimerase
VKRSRVEGGAAVVAAGGSGCLTNASRIMRGELSIVWPGDGAPVMMKGPAHTVFDGEWRYAEPTAALEPAS